MQTCVPSLIKLVQDLNFRAGQSLVLSKGPSYQALGLDGKLELTLPHSDGHSDGQTMVDGTEF